MPYGVLPYASATGVVETRSQETAVWDNEDLDLLRRLSELQLRFQGIQPSLKT